MTPPPHNPEDARLNFMQVVASELTALLPSDYVACAYGNVQEVVYILMDTPVGHMAIFYNNDDRIQILTLEASLLDPSIDPARWIASTYCDLAMDVFAGTAGLEKGRLKDLVDYVNTIRKNLGS